MISLQGMADNGLVVGEIGQTRLTDAADSHMKCVQMK